MQSLTPLELFRLHRDTASFPPRNQTWVPVQATPRRGSRLYFSAGSEKATTPWVCMYAGVREPRRRPG